MTFFTKSVRAGALILVLLLWSPSDGLRAQGQSTDLEAAPPGAAVDLRGYGKVSTSFGPDQTYFMCESEGKADILLGKLLADLFWDASDKHQEMTVSAQGKDVPVHWWPGYGAICIYRDRYYVCAIGADSVEGLLARLENENSLRGAVSFEPSKPYPIYLDFYDLKSFRVYTGAMGSAHNLGLDSHWQFIKQFGLGGIVFQGPGSWSRNPAEGVFQSCDADYEVREAAKNGGMAVPCPGGDEVGLWAYNKNPAGMKQPAPTALLGGWGGAGCAGAHYESAGVPDSVNVQNVALIMKRYVENPAIGGWQPYAGSPGAEMGFHDRSGDWWDYSPAGQASFRKWLREIKGYTLAGLGKAWWNDAAAFRSWEEVAVPDVLGFYGNLGAGSYLLNGTWFWKKAEIGETAPPASTDPRWAAFEMPPSQKEMFLPWGDAFYRTRFDASAWLSKNGGQAVYLVCSPYIHTKKEFELWLNGQPLGVVAGTGEPEPFSIEVGGRLAAGSNELAIRVPSGAEADTQGKIFGPVFLTNEKPASYPYLGREANARYVDLREWQAYSVYLSHLNMMEAARSIDPERPMNLSPGSSAPVADYANELGARFGMGLQMTGREAWYHPWWDGYGLVAGYYGTSEPSATAHGSKLSRMLGWILFDGDSSHTLFLNIEDYILEEQSSGWFTKNKRNIQLFGKYLREKPKLVLLCTSKNSLLGIKSVRQWDIGQGELQRAHFDYAYATERELGLGLLRDYPVLMDCGNEVLDERTMKDLTRYVTEGGIYIAIHKTGLHSATEAESYPLGALCGYQVAAKAKTGTILFDKAPPLFRQWAGREFKGEGIGLGDADPALAGTQAIARWADGGTAIGYRKVGKGAVVVLGSSFWRSGGIEQEFFEQLFAELGIERDANASMPSVWTRKVQTKNGLQDWLIAYNSDSSALQADVSFRLEARPAAVLNLETKQPVNFVYSQDGWVTVKNVAFEGNGVAAFAAKRADLIGGLPMWWNEKTTYWKRCAPGPAVNAKEQSDEPPTVGVDTWRFYADRDGALSAGNDWKAPGYDDASGGWRTLLTGPWNYQGDDLKDYNGVGLYRAKVNLPADWPGKTITLGLYSYDLPIAYSEAEFFLNGKSIAQYQERRWSQTLVYDVTGAARPGENILAVRVKGGNSISGIVGSVWLGTETEAREQLSLSGDWKAIKAEYTESEAVRLPGKVTGKYLTRDVDIPASWRGEPVYLHVEMPNQWLGSVLVNGHPINYNGYLHPFGLRAEINVTLYVRPGGSNTIELWPFATIPHNGQAYPQTGGNGSHVEAPMEVSNISLKKL